ncbi:hypothetical protein WCLP8_4940005 [uncultured Gammaproteobacteria bacterium]
MATRNVNYFGTFLDSMQSGSGQSGSGSASRREPISRSYRDEEASWEPARISIASDPLNEIVKALAEKEELGAKDLVSLTGGSLSTFIEASKQLAKLGFVDVSPTYTLRLTDQGRELASVLREALSARANGEP